MTRDEIKGFVRAVDLGGFTRAARELRMTPSALSKLVTRLERRLQVKLLARTTRKIALTAEGGIFLARCRRILDEMDGAENEVSGMRERPRGLLRMHVGVGFAIHQLIPATPRFLARYPEMQLELIVEDRFPNLDKENIDVSVWPGPPHDEALVARKLCEFERVVCAAPAYLSRHGAPRNPEDLANHNCIVIPSLPESSRWAFDGPGGRAHIDIRGSIAANNAECVLHFARMGLGVVRLNEFVVSEDIRSGALIRVLADWPGEERLPLHAHYAPSRHRPPRISRMLDFLVEAFGHAPWRAGSAMA